MKIRLLSLLLAAALSPTALARQNDFWNMCKSSNADMLGLQCEEINRICSKAQLTEIPDGDKPTEREKIELRGCSSSKLYFGKPSDPVNARKCAYLQIEQDKVRDPFDGIPILITVYENAQGVAQNEKLATKFACQDANSAPAEYESRLINLGTRDTFDYCQDITSGYMMGWCASRNADAEKLQREIKLERIISKWSVKDREEFSKLRGVWSTYAELSSYEAGGYPPTASGYFVISRRAALEDGFLSSLIEFESKKLPGFTINDFTRSDNELNSVYKKIQSAREGEVDWGPRVTKKEIKEAQRAWIKYRDAWVQFAKHRYPAVSEQSWKAWLTRERVEYLILFIENPQ